MKKYLSLALLVLSIASCSKNKNEANVYEVDSSVSVAKWKGSAPDHFHTGSFKVTGHISTNEGGKIKEGSFVLPIASIKNDDLPNPVKQQLLEHLKSPDFFNLALHPNAEFKITKVVPFTKTDTTAIVGANYLTTGNFSMIGQTHAISFPANITYTRDSLHAEATFDLDRTKWGMSSYTDPSKGLLILPNVAMHLEIKAGRKKF